MIDGQKFWFCAPLYRRKYVESYRKRLTFYLPVSSAKVQPIYLLLFNTFCVMFLLIFATLLRTKLVVSDPARVLQLINKSPRIACLPVVTKNVVGFWWNGIYELKLFEKNLCNLKIKHYFNKYINEIHRVEPNSLVDFYSFPEVPKTEGRGNIDDSHFGFCYIAQIFDIDDVVKHVDSRTYGALMTKIEEGEYTHQDEVFDCELVFRNFLTEVSTKREDVIGGETCYRLASYFFRLNFVVFLLRSHRPERGLVVGIEEEFIRKNFTIPKSTNIIVKNRIVFSETIPLMLRSIVNFDLGSKCFPDPNYPRAATLRRLGIDTTEFIFGSRNFTIRN